LLENAAEIRLLSPFSTCPFPWYIHTRVPGAWKGAVMVGIPTSAQPTSTFHNPLATLATRHRSPVPPPIVSELGNKVDINVLPRAAQLQCGRPSLSSLRRALGTASSALRRIIGCRIATAACCSTATAEFGLNHDSHRIHWNLR
jgi:hypothetical protein